jgi:hypothetical protein
VVVVMVRATHILKKKKIPELEFSVLLWKYSSTVGTGSLENKTARQVNKTARRVNKTARRVKKSAVRLEDYR